MKAQLNIMRITLTTTLIMIMLFLSACGKRPQDKLIGIWQEVDGEQSIVEFFEDGSFSMRLEEGEIGSLENLNGKWIILKDGRIKMDISMLGMTHSEVGKLDFADKEMIITTDDGGVSRHKRLQAIPEREIKIEEERRAIELNANINNAANNNVKIVCPRCSADKAKQSNCSFCNGKGFIWVDKRKFK